ncbi:MAG: hypothetical protein UX85_C0004G0005 [Candidatus Beckwithbacteria bacterium GW2011_GWB1_47_15]|uniref:Uncharacterized protein n=1 Tax=Candidatus Beckwithbacteria bacterium GW2011_GWB1_47_15 TaxID=1618371 RepID=A0A0G1RUU3_9BACT|nr:MAG: hypothetical protein UY43_C0001G0244 [Candidatus Beckwithbacteria bacterium GW2011_GWC1_49_16]KKU35409.1 MAG: hypothetical protein UX50_C0003G0005 [Candidatus Beckwithbacteria bacterium GW2011_GWA1_46_30]KKU61084.1 MAG: hypothetical protein UX85_C0004G0005 [Candidatus Beckwithbacteria bacterium GW2011_GWB1_47_15]KKU71923.1 MAG: hypothetical protein UX97_C0002G0005 [Candidatus Beckwithbacteria bacterium GW2011_GWA2_47_25]KKW02938.1 MAG: hypothetical protein UY37_C0009G0012 [Candidatus Be
MPAAEQLSRRNFLKVATIFAAGAAVESACGGLLKPEQESTIEPFPLGPGIGTITLSADAEFEVFSIIDQNGEGFDVYRQAFSQTGNQTLNILKGNVYEDKLFSRDKPLEYQKQGPPQYTGQPLTVHRLSLDPGSDKAIALLTFQPRANDLFSFIIALDREQLAQASLGGEIDIIVKELNQRHLESGFFTQNLAQEAIVIPEKFQENFKQLAPYDSPKLALGDLYEFYLQQNPNLENDFWNAFGLKASPHDFPRPLLTYTQEPDYDIALDSFSYPLPLGTSVTVYELTEGPNGETYALVEGTGENYVSDLGLRPVHNRYWTLLKDLQLPVQNQLPKTEDYYKQPIPYSLHRTPFEALEEHRANLEATNAVKNANKTATSYAAAPLPSSTGRPKLEIPNTLVTPLTPGADETKSFWTPLLCYGGTGLTIVFFLIYASRNIGSRVQKIHQPHGLRPITQKEREQILDENPGIDPRDIPGFIEY